MPELNEELLQFIWQNRLLKSRTLVSATGAEIMILNPGELNKDSGPDFFNARIKSNGIILAGNVEIHTKTSDWLKHGHVKDRNYDTIILHVVYEHDVDLAQNREHSVEVLEIKPFVERITLETYNHLMHAKEKLACGKQLESVNGIKFISWLERMALERLENKVNRIEELFGFYKGDYTQTFFTLLLKSYGFKVNAVPFELLARQLPVQLLLKHRDNLLQLEALFFGMSGLLEDQFENSYVRQLQNEFEFLRNKYQLKPLKKEIFKFSKLRPANFPNIRLAQLANTMHKHPEIFTEPQNKKVHAEIANILMAGMEGYWKNHYSMDGKLLKNSLAFGKTSAESVIINAFVPFFFFYAKKQSRSEYKDLAIELMTACALELNTKTRLFLSKKDVLKSAADSQALINLYDNYCKQKRCLKCGIAAALLNNSPIEKR